MSSTPCVDICSSNALRKGRAKMGSFSSFPLLEAPTRFAHCSIKDRICSQRSISQESFLVLKRIFLTPASKKKILMIPLCSSSSDRNGGNDESSDQNKTPFGYTRKDVLLIGLGLTIFGIALKTGLEFVGVDPLQAGNVVQLVLVLGLTVGWISTYIFRVSNKEMTYAQQLRDYEVKVMEKRLESLTEAEVQALLEQVEEEKRQMVEGEQVK